MTMRRGLFTALAVLVCVAGLAAQKRGGWVLIGEQTVTDRQDHDTIVVSGARGTFTAIRFEVRRRSVDVRRVVVHFGNGGDQEVELRSTIRAGGRSRDIDLEGAGRVIRSIDLWYDAKSIGRGGEAVVRVYGRD